MGTLSWIPWTKVIGSISTVVFVSLFFKWWQAEQAKATARGEIAKLRSELTSMRVQCNRWRMHTEQQERDRQMEIHRFNEIKENHNRELRKLGADLAGARELSDNWRRHSEQQMHDLRRERSRRARAEERVLSGAPDAYHEQMKDLSDE